MTHSDLDERILRRLSAGGADPILVADFQALSLAPRMSEMLSESVQGKPVFQIDPIGVLTGTRHYVPLRELAEGCADEFLRSGADHGRIFVVGHCSAAALCLRVADLLASSRQVTAVLVQPAWPDDDLVADKFAEYLSKFGKATRPCPDLNADPSQVVAAMEQIFRDEIDALAASRDLTGSMGAFTDLLVWYRGWLAFLLACRNDPSTNRAAGRAAVTILSDSPSTLEVKGLGEDEYQMRELSTPQPAGMVTRELADLVAAYVGSH
ncbi:alpha/beta fold hydrolase [Dactylosporangium sp. NPDC005555]|uniref:alpha/beta fold hydrolase n=1 Tax=Dactylosporangium sp. NPDC005555 TaxID=3154889 RepID=UPI0033B6BF41